MTIMVALSQVIPLSDFNVALGYNLSRPKQVLLTHPRTRSPARTHRRARTHTPCFPPASADVSQRAYVSQIQCMCACLRLTYPKMFFSCATAGAT